MKIKQISIFLIAGTIILSNCSKKQNPVELKLDYTAKTEWKYSVDYSSQAIFSQNDSTTTLKTSIISEINAVPYSESKKLVMKTENLSLTSDMMQDSVKKEITAELSRAEYSLLLENGAPAFDTAAKLPEGSFQDWNLYRQFGKLLPSLPAGKIPKGFEWERTVSLPVRTILGIIPCEVFVHYRLDSISADNNSAFLNWQIRYSADQKFIDSIDILKQIPVSGEGYGSATIDVVNRYITEAKMEFNTPVATIGKITVSWKEFAVMKYISCK